MRRSYALTFCLVAAVAPLSAQGFSAGPRQGLAPPAGAVELVPGDDIQSAVDANPEGTRFHLAAGLYRIQAVQPKNSDSFVGDAGATLNGAKLLTKFARAGALYVARHQPIDPDTLISGVCLPGFPRCDHPQDLYFDGLPLRAVAKRGDVIAGTFFYDYHHDAVYFADDPSGHVVELSYRPVAFGGAAKNVTVRNLIVENYASADQQGAINSHGDGAGWTIADNDVRWNHGLGVVDGAHNRVTGNLIEHNGEMGLGGGSGVTGALVKDNEIAGNVWNGTDCNWECGGGKWGNVFDLKIIGNYVHDNQGDGLWTDIDCKNILYDGNIIENNLYAGISHEISEKAVIRNNVLKGNGATAFQWGWDGQIQIQNSSGVEVTGNTLVLDPARGGNGIIIVQQKRGARHMPHDNWIHDNDVTMAGGDGAVVGWFADYRWKDFAASNLFDNNHYHVGRGVNSAVWAPNDWVNFTKWQSAGQDTHSTVDRGAPAKFRGAAE